MTLILVGQTELWDQKLRLQRYAVIRQRIDINCVLPHLDRSETERYIISHLKYSGCPQEQLFTEKKAIDEIYRGSTGIPRIVNRICEKTLMYAFQQQHKLIDDYMVRYVEEHESSRTTGSVKQWTSYAGSNNEIDLIRNGHIIMAF